jgi:hypothetical protein
VFRKPFLFIATATMLLLSCGSPETAAPPPEPDPNKSAYENDSTGWTDLMPEANLARWTKVPIPPTDELNPKDQWEVRDGMLIMDGTGGHEWLRFDGKQFESFIMHVEWRFKKLDEGEPRYNGGVYFWANDDGSQFYQAQTVEAGGWIFGAVPQNGEPQRINKRDEMGENRVKPAGEWNTFEIHATPAEVRLWVNGDVQNRLENPPATSGYIGLEAEGFHMEFRKLLIKELP